jgi:hypothetical protein
MRITGGYGGRRIAQAARSAERHIYTFLRQSLTNISEAAILCDPGTWPRMPADARQVFPKSGNLISGIPATRPRGRLKIGVCIGAPDAFSL